MDNDDLLCILTCPGGEGIFRMIVSSVISPDRGKGTIGKNDLLCYLS